MATILLGERHRAVRLSFLPPDREDGLVDPTLILGLAAGRVSLLAAHEAWAHRYQLD